MIQNWYFLPKVLCIFELPDFLFHLLYSYEAWVPTRYGVWHHKGYGNTAFLEKLGYYLSKIWKLIVYFINSLFLAFRRLKFKLMDGLKDCKDAEKLTNHIWGISISRGVRLSKIVTRKCSLEQCLKIWAACLPHSSPSVFYVFHDLLFCRSSGCTKAQVLCFYTNGGAVFPCLKELDYWKLSPTSAPYLFPFLKKLEIKNVTRTAFGNMSSNLTTLKSLSILCISQLAFLREQLLHESTGLMLLYKWRW